MTSSGLLHPRSNNTYTVLLCNLTPELIELPARTLVAQADSSENYKTFTPEYGTEKDHTLLSQLHIDRTQFNSTQLSVVDQLLLSMTNILAGNTSKPGTTHLVKHGINTNSNKPINQAPYRTAFKEKAIIEDKVKDMLRDNIVQHSKSPWASPVVLVSKKDGSIRFCVDYRRLNEVTERDAYPLPRIDDCLSMLQGNLYFSSLDLHAYYWQIPMEPQDKSKTAFVTAGGLFEFNVMPFGLTNAPATSQRLMDAVFAGLKWRNLLVYLDDIIIFSNSFDQHVKDLQEAFERLRSSQLKLKPSKCFLFQKELTYLGHLVSREGIRPDPGKVKALLSMPQPKTKSEVRSFLGMCNYYRKFIADFSKVSHCLNDLTRDTVHFHWNKEHREAFKTLTSHLSSAPILAHPDFNIPFKVQTDASDFGLGAILSQTVDGKERVVQYLSRTLQPAERKWCVREKEALAIIFACESFRPYIIGSRFTIETDQQSLQWLMKAKAPARLVRWALRLAEFDFSIKYKKGSENSNADCLSRLITADTSEATEQISVIRADPMPAANWLEEQRKDPELQLIISKLEEGQSCPPFTLEKQLLYHDDQLAVPLKFVERILTEYHNKNAHLARNRLLEIMKARFFWPKMHKNICDWVNACLQCRRFKPDQPLCHGLLKPIEVKAPFETVGIDIVGPFHLSPNRNRYIVVCIDLFTNWIEAAPLKSLTAKVLADTFYKLVITRHGCPKNVLSDQGTQFTSSIFKDMCKQFNIHHLETTAYHQQCNGKTERFNKFLCKSIATMLNASQTNWDELMHDCIFIYRTTVSRVLDDSPFFMLYARDPILPQDLVYPLKRPILENTDVTLQNHKIEQLRLLTHAYDRLTKRRKAYQAQYKAHYDQKHKEVNFKENDMVMVYFPASKVGMTYKFLAKWDGPFTIIAKLNDLNYRVMSLAGDKTLVVHVQRMLSYKPWVVLTKKI